MTHTITPTIPVWKGFGPSKFAPTVNPENGQPYNYEKDGFSATAYQLSTDQLGTQLDPPAPWNPDFPSIDELPATFAVRPLVVISIVDQVAKDPKYALQVQDILDWEKKHGKIPEGSVVFVRCDWSKKWPDPSLATDPNFPGVSLAALKFLHLQRKILFTAMNRWIRIRHRILKAKPGSCATVTPRPRASLIWIRFRRKARW